MRNRETFKGIIIPIIIQIFLLVCFAFYWSYFSQTNKMMEFVLFFIPTFILMSLVLLVVTRNRHKMRERMLRSEEEQQITIGPNDELKHDLIAYAIAFIILVIAKTFSSKVDSADVLQAGVALLSIYLVKRIYFGKIR
jgi:hypothetical protein